MGQDSELEKRFQQLQAAVEERNARQDSFEKKQDDQFAFMRAKMDQLLGSFTELRKVIEQKDRSVSFDSMKANVDSTSKGGRYAGDGRGFHAGDGKGWRYAGDGGGFQRLKITSFHMEDSQEQQIDEIILLDDCSNQKDTSMEFEKLHPVLEKVDTQEEFKNGAEECQEIENADNLEQEEEAEKEEEEEEEEEENKMIQETSLVEDTHHAFDEIPQPSQMKLSISKSIKVKVGSKRLYSRLRWNLGVRLCFNTRRRMMCMCFFKHRWRWKKKMWEVLNDNQWIFNCNWRMLAGNKY
jgi:hypothetical protein